MGIKRSMYFLTATLALLFFSFAAQGEEKPFITKWKAEANKELKIPIFGTNYKLVIKKASDNTELKTEASLIITANDNFYTYTSTEDGELLVEAGPEGVEYIRFVDDNSTRGSAANLLTVEQFGTVVWKSMNCAFAHCKNMQFASTVGTPDLSNVTDMESMFDGCFAFNQNLGSWNLKKCTSLGLSYCGMSVENYSKSLEGWAAQADINEKLVLRADGLYFNETAKSARTKLIKEKHWVIRNDVSEGGRVYNLHVGGIQLSTDNINTFQDVLTEVGVLRKGKVSVTLEGEKPVLKLENSELTAPYEGFPTYMLECKSSEVTILLQGVSTITQLSYDFAAIVVRKGTIVGRNTNDKLLVKGDNVYFSTVIRNCTVEIGKELKGIGKAFEIDNAVVKAKRITRVSPLILKNCSILQPDGARYDEAKREVVDKDGNTAENVVIGVPITLDHNQLSLAVGKDATLKANVTNLTNKEVEWSCDKPDIATVDQNGKVTAKAVGKATITAKTKEGGYTAKCEVTVTLPNAVEDAVFANIIVSPNPFDTQLRIANGNLEGEYILLNAQGVKVDSGVLGVSETIVNTSALSAGIYLLQLNAKGGATKTYRVVK
ncbi:MAG: Ig-like domain-containing protein [Bacteroides sp.]